MAHRHAEHAKRVVDNFKAVLSEDPGAKLNDNHFDELSVLIESAISSAVLDEMEQVVMKVEKLAHELQTTTEHFEHP